MLGFLLVLPMVYRVMFMQLLLRSPSPPCWHRFRAAFIDLPQPLPRRTQATDWHTDHASKGPRLPEVLVSEVTSSGDPPSVPITLPSTLFMANNLDSRDFVRAAARCRMWNSPTSNIASTNKDAPRATNIIVKLPELEVASGGGGNGGSGGGGNGGGGEGGGGATTMGTETPVCTIGVEVDSTVTPRLDVSAAGGPASRVLVALATAVAVLDDDALTATGTVSTTSTATLPLTTLSSMRQFGS